MSVLFSRREENAIITRNIKKKKFQYFFNSHSEADKTYLKNKINSSLNFLIYFISILLLVLWYIYYFQLLKKGKLIYKQNYLALRHVISWFKSTG